MKKLIALFSAVLVPLVYSAAGNAVSHLSESNEAEDHGGKPWVVDIEDITLDNSDFRAARWTGEYLQMTLMSIPEGGRIGGEVHHNNDQFIRIELGDARVLMGPSADNITFDEEVSEDWAVFIPAGYWHDLINIGETEVQLYSIYGPPEHPAGTIHRTFEESEEAHHHH